LSRLSTPKKAFELTTVELNEGLTRPGCRQQEPTLSHHLRNLLTASCIAPKQFEANSSGVVEQKELVGFGFALELRAADFRKLFLTETDVDGFLVELDAGEWDVNEWDDHVRDFELVERSFILAR
jgi:hypothetical protein